MFNSRHAPACVPPFRCALDRQAHFLRGASRQQPTKGRQSELTVDELKHAVAPAERETLLFHYVT
jgi:hypothetical protein